MKESLVFTPITKRDSKEKIYKSNILVNGKYDITLVQARFIAFMSSFINAYDEDFLTYEISASEVLEFLKVERANINWLEKTLGKLLRTIITLRDDERGLAATTFLSYFYLDRKTNKIQVRFDASIKHCYVQLKNNFTPLKLNRYIEFTSIYSIRFYEWLEYNIRLYDKYKNRMYSNIEIDVDELKNKIAAKYNDKKGDFLIPKSYEEFRDFKRKVLEPARKELKEKSDIYFEYDEIKNGKKVEKIIINIYKNGERISKEFANKKRTYLLTSNSRKIIAQEQIKRIVERTPNIKKRVSYEQELFQRAMSGTLNYDRDLEEILEKISMDEISKTQIKRSVK